MILDNTMLMYGVYNAETLEKLIQTVHEIHNVTSSHEKLFAGEYEDSLFRILYKDALGRQQYATDSLLFLRIIQDKYISLCRELITQLHTYVSAIRISAKGYLPNTLITPRKLQEILLQVRNSLLTTNLDYTLVLDRLHLYYDMQLITFGINSNTNLVIQFPVFIQPYTQKPLILYQLETVSVPILDQNIKAQSYTHLRIKKPYIALNSETYISLRQQELRSCKRIGYEFCCKELFVVKHKSSWPNDKHIICNMNNDIPVKIPSHPYVLVNRSVLCNCRIEADNHHLLESLTTCDNKVTKLIMYFIINLTFTNYLNMIPNLTDSIPMIKDRTRYEQPLHLNLSLPHFDNSLRYKLTKLKDYMNNYINDKDIFDFQQRHAIESDTFTSNKNFFSSHIVNIFTFTSSIISILTIMLVIYLYCKHKYIITIVASLILHKIKEVEANSNHNLETNNCECRTLAYVGIIFTVLSMIIVMFLHYR